MAKDFRFELGTTWLNLQSTMSGRLRDRTVELLDTPQRLQEWLTAVGLGPLRKADGADLIRARVLREAVYAIVRAAADGEPMPRPAVRTLNEFLALDRAPRISVTADGLAAGCPKDADEALARIARQAADALTGPNPVRLHTCSDELCSGVFVDDTGRRRWCSDTRCGSRARVTAHRARVAGRRR